MSRPATTKAQFVCVCPWSRGKVGYGSARRCSLWMFPSNDAQRPPTCTAQPSPLARTPCAGPVPGACPWAFPEVVIPGRGLAGSPAPAQVGHRPLPGAGDLQPGPTEAESKLARQG